MEFLTKDVCMKQWVVFAMLLTSGFGFGALVARLAIAAGF